MRHLSLSLACAAVLCSQLAPITWAEAPAIELPPGGDQFARTLYGKLSARSGNLAFSPASIDTCLLLAYAGARGETAAEMAKTLKLTEQDAAEPGRLLATAMARVAKTREPKGGAVLNVANSAWVERTFPIQSAYRQMITKSGGAKFELVDFAKQPDAARRTINAWIGDHTEQKIKDLLAPRTIDGNTRLVLANAIYFKAGWQDEFSKAATKDAPFHRLGQPDVQVRLMHQIDHFDYGETDTYQVVRLAYRDSEYSMVVWLPRKLEGLAALEKQLAAEGTGPSVENLDYKEVDLFLPRFKVNAQVQLAETLAALGMQQAFTPSANFSGITDKPLWISAVVHEAVVEVDEKGTEAAAATAIVAPTAAAPEQDPPKPKVFRADHPFMYAIRHRETGDVLFWGRVEKP